jgi:hypothetical protein
VLLVLGAAVFGTAWSQTAPVQWVRPGYYKELKPERWNDRVARMLKVDAANPPAPQGVMFVGSATIAGWDLKHYFPQYRTTNRGIGGSLISEATFFADQLIVPFKPSTIVFYSGDNDTAYGMTPEMVAEDFGKFVAKIHGALPDTRMVVLSIRPSIARLEVWDVVAASNRKLAAVVANQGSWIRFTDLTGLLLTPEGKPARELLGPDLHHLNEAGFDLVSPVVNSAIERAEKRP